MKTILRFAGGLLLCSALLTPKAQAYLTVNGSGDVTVTNPAASFNELVGAASFDRASGNYFFGQEGSGTAYNICYANYRTPNQTPTLQPLLATSTLYNDTIQNLRAVTSVGNPNVPTILASSHDAAPGTLYGLTTQNTTLASLQLNNSTLATDAAGEVYAIAGGNDLFFAVVTGGTDTFGLTTSGIAAGTITRDATTNAVSLNLYDPVAGTASADAAALCADFTCSPDNTTYNTAPAGATGNDKLPAFAYGTSAVVPTNAPTQQADAWFDPILGNNSDFNEVGRLFVGTSLSTGRIAGSAVSLAWGVGTFIVNQTATTLNVTPTMLTPTTAFSSVVNGSADTYMVVAANDSSLTGTSSIQVSHVRTMHTSTGLVYLIASGGISHKATLLNGVSAGEIIADNNVWALPLVNGSGAANTDGLMADQTSGNFTVAVDTANFGQGGAQDMITTASPAALVGGFYVDATTSLVTSLSVPCGPAPAVTAAESPFVNSFIADMYVDNDAVYVATSDANNGNSPLNAGGDTIGEMGLWRSQAVFNALGQIDHWTDWQKVIPNDMGTPTTPGTDGSVDFAVVDGYTGHVWAVNNNNGTNPRATVTQWTNASATNQTGLAAAVNAALNNLCYSVLDLNASTTNWGSETVQRATLFGGNGLVCFASTGTAIAVDRVGTTTDTNIMSSDASTNYFANSYDLFTTELPTNAGAVIALGFSGWTSNGAGNGGDTNAYSTPGFFLAGCAGTATSLPGLYAYVSNVETLAGFDPQSITVLEDLNTANAGWVKLANVVGLPTKIQSLGGNLHVLARSVSQDRIFTTAKADDAGTLNASFIVTASAGEGSLSGAAQILDFAISFSADSSAFAPTNGTEQLIALTTDGIYTTSCVIDDGSASSPFGMNASLGSLNQNAAGWAQVEGSTNVGNFADYLGQPDYNRYPQMFHLANFVANANIPYKNGTVYNRNSWFQAGRQSFDAGSAPTTSAFTNYAENPSALATYNVASGFDQTTAPSIYENFPVNARLLYDDGSRRFFVQANPSNAAQYQVLVLPYNAYDYNITTNDKAIMKDTAVAAANGFFWMSPIGDLGRLTMSTTNGLISLQ